MAIAKFSDIIGDASGRIAGAVIARNIHATYLRPYRPAANPASSVQHSQRLRYSLISAAWSALSAIQRAAYDTFAADTHNYVTNRLGDDVPLSGWQTFVRQSQNLLIASLALPTAPPSTPFPTAPVINAIFLYEQTPSVWVFSYTFPTDEFLNHYSPMAQARKPSPGSQTANSGWKFIRCGAPIAGSSTTATTATLRVFGTPINGSMAFMRIARMAADGGRSPDTIASCLIPTSP